MNPSVKDFRDTWRMLAKQAPLCENKERTKTAKVANLQIDAHLRIDFLIPPYYVLNLPYFSHFLAYLLTRFKEYDKVCSHPQGCIRGARATS